MKKLFLILLCSVFFLTTASFTFAKDTYVNGYRRKDGTYVRPHYRSTPDNSFSNNWSTKGNTNPYTGKPGYKKK